MDSNLNSAAVTHIPIDRVPAFLHSTLRIPPPHKATIYRWIQRGVGGARLATTKVGGRTFVRETDLLEFIRACNSKRTF